MLETAVNFYESKLFLGIVYFLIVNGYGFITMGLDKYYAKKHKWRIPERSFFFVSLIGGALGVFVGMKSFRHKTQHRSFMLGIPVLLVMNIALIGMIYYYLLS